MVDRFFTHAHAHIIPIIICCSYCQGMGMLTAFALLMLEEEHAFWLLQAILHSRRTEDYYGVTLLGAMADQSLLQCVWQTRGGFKIKIRVPICFYALNSQDVVFPSNCARELIHRHLPRVDAALTQMDFSLPLVTLNWYDHTAS